MNTGKCGTKEVTALQETPRKPKENNLRKSEGKIGIGPSCL